MGFLSIVDDFERIRDFAEVLTLAYLVFVNEADLCLNNIFHNTNLHNLCFNETRAKKYSNT